MRIEHRRGRRPDLLLLLWVVVTLGVLLSTGAPAAERARATTNLSLHITPPAPPTVMAPEAVASAARAQTFGLWLTLRW